jgi:hypothetical protein
MNPEHIQDQRTMILQGMTEHTLSLLTLIQQLRELELKQHQEHHQDPN